MSPEDISALKQTVARFVEQQITPSMGAYEAAGEFPHGLIEAMGSAGFFGASFPEALGGSAMGFHAVAVIAEEISRLAPEFGYAMNLQAMTCPFTIYNWGSPISAPAVPSRPSSSDNKPTATRIVTQVESCPIVIDAPKNGMAAIKIRKRTNIPPC